MEGDAEEAGADAGVDGGGVPDGVTDDLLRAGARGVVEVEGELLCGRRQRTTPLARRRHGACCSLSSSGGAEQRCQCQDHDTVELGGHLLLENCCCFCVQWVGAWWPYPHCYLYTHSGRRCYKLMTLSNFQMVSLSNLLEEESNYFIFFIRIIERVK